MEKYYISDGKTETGPYSLEQLKQIPLNKNSLIWKQGMEKWLKISELPELKELVYAVPPPVSKQKERIIRNYRIKHFIITIVILFIIGKYLYFPAWKFFLNYDRYGQGWGEKAFLTVFLCLLITVILSIIIYNRNIDKLKK